MNLKTDVNYLSLPELVGGGYGTFWRFKGRYRVVKGSRASKKSKTTALWFITNLMKYTQANLLVVRKTYRTLQDSCYKELLWAINRLKVNKFWKENKNPLELTYLPTGQKILFRGLDDPLKVTSITVDTGYLCWAWIEEAYEITNEADFDMLDESIRGKVPEGYFKQFTLTFNPWNDRHWLKHRFFDDIVGEDEEGNPIYKERQGILNEDGSILSLTTNYKMNEWLDEEDLKVFETMKKRNPKRYLVAGLGNWGVIDGLVYENWKEQKFELEDVAYCKTYCGLDFGYTNDPTAFIMLFLDKANKKLYVWDEIYEKGLSNKKIYDKIAELGYTKERITADSAEPKSIDELKTLGLRHIKGAKKGRDSINNGIQWIQELEIIVHPRCVNFITEISNYMWAKDKFDKKLNKPIDDFNHLMDAMRYALEENITGDKWIY